MENIEHKPREVIIAELERKRKRLAVIVWGGVLPVIALLGVIGLYGLFTSAPKPSWKADVKEADWERREIPNSCGFTINSPFDLKNESRMSVKDQGAKIECSSYSYYKSRIFSVEIHFRQNSGVNTSVEEQVQEIIDGYGDMQGLNYYSTEKADTVFCKDIPGRRMEGVLITEHKAGKYLISVYVKEDKVWIVQLFYKRSDHNDVIARRIINSVKIEDK